MHESNSTIYSSYKNVLNLTEKLEEQLKAPLRVDAYNNVHAYITSEIIRLKYISINIDTIQQVKKSLDKLRINDKKVKLLLGKKQSMAQSESIRKKTYLEEIQYVKNQVQKVENICSIHPETVPRREHKNSRKTVISNMKYLDQWQRYLDQQNLEQKKLNEIIDNYKSDVRVRPEIQNKARKRLKHVSSTVDLFLDDDCPYSKPLSPVKEDDTVLVRANAIINKQTYQDQKNRISDDLAIFHLHHEKSFNNYKPKIVAYSLKKGIFTTKSEADKVLS